MTLALRSLALAGAIAAMTAGPAQAFCGFYVSSATADLFNDASQVVMARDGQQTTITMASDYRGDVADFALIIPVPEVPGRDDIRTIAPSLVDDIDAYSAPRLVEYFDEDPCRPQVDRSEILAFSMAAPPVVETATEQRADDYGVTVEAEYEVDEYDIQVLSAEQSGGLIRYLQNQGYRIPDGAEDVVGSYLRQGMTFFVAQVSLERHDASATTRLNPIQVTYNSPRFMLPIRLGTVNAEGPQEVILYAMSHMGRVEPVNYRTVELPTDLDVPLYVADQFPSFYTALFDRTSASANDRAVVLEYAWVSANCDPCAAPPLPVADLVALGANTGDSYHNNVLTRPLYITRLHVRYTADTHPEDIVLQETGNQQTFQGRYILRHPVSTSTAMACEAGRNYLAGLPARHERQAQTLANLTGWDVNQIRTTMAGSGQTFDSPIRGHRSDRPWYQRIFE